MLDLDKNHQLQPSIRQIEPLDDLQAEIRKKSSFESGLYFEEESSPSNISKLRGQNSDGSLDGSFKKEDNNKPNEKKRLKNDLMHESDDDAMHISSKKQTNLPQINLSEFSSPTIQITEGKENQRADNMSLRHRDSKNLGEIVIELDPEKEQKKLEDAILMIRGDHICALQELAFARKKQFQIQRNLFFDKASRLLNKYLGNIVVGFHSQNKERTMKKMRSNNSKMAVSERIISRPKLAQQYHISLERINRETRFKSNEARIKPTPNQRAPLLFQKFDEQNVMKSSDRHTYWLEQFLKAKKFDFALNPNEKLEK